MAKLINSGFISPEMTTDAELDAASTEDRKRENHTGTQTASTISDFSTAVQGVSLDASQIGNGSVSNSEFQQLDGISTSSNIQTQLNGKVTQSDMQKTNLVYVSPSGSNTNGDGSYSKPYQTIAHAISNSSDGATIFLFSGLYTESKITIPSSTGTRAFKSFSSSTTEIQNGFSHTASAANIGFSFESINLNSIELDETLATNGLISFTKCTFAFTRSDNNVNVLVTVTESTVPSGTISGGSNTFNECLFISNTTLSGGTTYFENSKFVAPVLANGQSTARMLDCSLFGAAEFIIGTIVGGNTPIWEVDSSTEYLGGYAGDVNKTILSNAGALAYTPEDVANKSTNTALGTSNTLYPTQNAVKEYVDGQVSTLNAVDTEIMGIFNDTKEPTGHVDRTQSTMSFDEGTRTLSIGPVSGSFTVYVKGVKLEISSTLTKQIPDTSGNYFFYIDANGDLDYFFSFNPLVLTDVAYTAFVHWNATLGQTVAFGEERHGTVMDGVTHSYLHTTRGTQLVSGGSITYSVGSGASDTDAQIGLANMQVKDEDITANISHASSPSLAFQQVLNPVAYVPVHYRDGSEWVKATASKYPLLFGTNRAKYNLFNGTTWSLEEASADNKTLVSYIFATTNISQPVICLLGQDQYDTLEEAKSLAAWDQITFGDLPAQEMKLLYLVFYETSSAYANEPKSKIVYVSDVRYNVDRQVSATVFNGAHGNLSGLENDDHAQYHNNARGDARYYLKSEVDSAISSASTDDRNRANHTGTQLASTISDFTTAVQGVTIDAAKIDGGVVSNAEFATLDGITTGVSIQSQINGKQATITGGATSITSLDLTTNRALQSDASGKVAISATTSTELSFVSGVTSAIQTQLNAKVGSLTGDVTLGTVTNGTAAATLANSGVTAGTYGQVTVDAKGRVTSGVVNRYVYKTTATQASTAAAYAALTELTSVSLPVGLYRFSAYIIAQTAATTTGIGFRVGAGTATISTIGSKWFISQAADGTAKNFQVDQLAANTNVTSASALTANANFQNLGEGVFRVTVAGTVRIEFRTEVAASAATVQPDSVLIIEAL